jgi:hypothetical protein
MMSPPRPILLLRPHARRETRTWRDAGRRLFALCLAALVLVGTLAAGRTYLWCSMMEQRVETCCCAAERGDGEREEDKGSELRNGCCASHSHDALTVARVSTDLLEIPPAVVVLAAPVPALAVVIPVRSHAPSSPSCAARTRPIRAGPRHASATCAELQVFRC